jgi:hypothetical protein
MRSRTGSDRSANEFAELFLEVIDLGFVDEMFRPSRRVILSMVVNMVLPM